MSSAGPVPQAPHPDEVEDRQFVVALARGLSVLQAFRAGDDVLSNAEIAGRTQLPKATITRLTYTLCMLGYLSRDAARTGYRLDPHILALGFPVLARLGVRQLARPMMQSLALEERLTVSMGMRDGGHMIYVDRVRSDAPVVLEQDVGTRIPIATTALGRAYLAGLTAADRSALLAELRASVPSGAWAALKKGVDRELERHRAKGYCFGGAWNPEVTGVAVPLDLPGRTLLALSCAGARASLTEVRLAAIGGRLVDIVRRLRLAQDTRL